MFNVYATIGDHVDALWEVEHVFFIFKCIVKLPHSYKQMNKGTVQEVSNGSITSSRQ
jgi:hypothetical protein